MHVLSLLVALPLASASAIPYTSAHHARLLPRQTGMAMNYSSASQDFFPGGKFGFSNTVSVLTSFTGLGGVNPDIPGMVEDLEFVFPSIKSSGWGKSIENGFRGGIDGLIDSVTAAQLAPSKPSATTAWITSMIAAAMANGMMPTAQQLTQYYQLLQWYFSDPGNLMCKFFQNPSNQFYVATLSGYFGNPTKSMAPDACEKDTTGGSGPYSSSMVEDASLPGHTIYAPKSKPSDNVKLPVIVWGNGGCVADGALFQTALTEIASHGYLVIATGTIKGGGGLSLASDMTKSIDWSTSAAAKKYGNVDASRLAVAGQNCGGLEAMTASYHDPRVKFIALVNSGVFEKAKLPLLQELTVPIAYFVGGTPDIAYPLASLLYPPMIEEVVETNDVLTG
jgi:hypothetical protein